MAAQSAVAEEGAAVVAVVVTELVMEGAAVTTPIALRECLVFPGTQVRREQDATRLIFTPEHEIHCDEHD